jgi:hypothetical protein
MILQTIHPQKGSTRASSIYCRWIRNEPKEGSPLVAVWIDSEMRGFEQEFASRSVTDPAQEGALDEPGGVRSLQLLRQTFIETMA